MLWSNWQGAIWRGAMLVVLIWSGLAWTQAPVQRPAVDPTDRIMVVHENGKSTRCRVMETWQLPDRRVAHLLQALDTGEMITIVDDQSNDPGTPATKNPRAMPKRIFAWGQRRTAPEGSPLPPHMRIDSGIVLNQEAAPPLDAIPADGPVVVSAAVDDRAIGSMVVHANGKNTRCQVVETWQLPDRRVAHLLKAVETGEMITIVDDHPNGSGTPATRNSRDAPKRIFAWGQRRTPPEGSPLPPHMRIDSGVVLAQEAAPPQDAVPVNGPVLNQVQVLDYQKSQGSLPQIVQTGAAQSGSGLQIIQAGDPRASSGGQIIQAANPSETGGPQIIQVAADPLMPTPGANAGTVPGIPGVQSGTPVAGSNPPTYVLPSDTPAAQPWRPGQKLKELFPNRSAASTEPARPISGGLLNPSSSISNANAPVVAPPASASSAQPATLPAATSASMPAPSLVSDPKLELTGPNDTVAKKPWRPGEKVWDWFSGKSQAKVAKTDPAKTADTKPTETKLADTTKPTLPKSEDAKKVQQSEDYLANENKQLEKKLQEKIAKMYNAPFSTAMGTQVAEPKKADAAPLAIPSAAAAPKDDKVSPLPPLVPGEIKQTSGPLLEKKNMWGMGANDSVLPPGKSVLDGGFKPGDVAKVPPLTQSRANDPLMMPERFVDKTKRASVLAPIPSGDMNVTPGDPSVGSAWPLGSQSVLAARGGLQGPVTYVPVPVVTVPAPFNPPQPPEPKLPDAPQLNAFVNAFSEPQQPKGTQQYPTQGMNPYANPMMQQQMMQQQAMQQYAMQQYAMQQQAMNPNGYRPATYPPMPYGQQMVSQGPAMNFSRQYTGPLAPNLVGGPGPVMPAGYAPMPYPPIQAPQQPMMPQYQTQPVTYQQPTAAPMQPIAGGQVDQLIKVLRESPYPAQREWAAQSLTSFEWRTHPQIVPNLLQSASQDPAPSVRAGCVYCLGRMQAAVEPVFNTLHSLRNDIDPRVRQEVEQTFVRLGQTPMAPQ